MFETVGRAGRRMGMALLIAAAPLGGFAATGALAQIPPGVPGMPAMGAAATLTSELVAAWAISYPEIVALTEQVGAQYNVPTGDDPMAAMAALGAVTAAMGQLNAAVAAYGFTDYAHWTNVTIAITIAYAVVAAPPEQQAMLTAMFQVSEENRAAVAANLDAVAAVIDE